MIVFELIPFYSMLLFSVLPGVPPLLLEDGADEEDRETGQHRTQNKTMPKCICARSRTLSYQFKYLRQHGT